MLMPGLRVGYLVVEGPAMERIVERKRVTELTTSPFIQRTLNEFVTVGRYQAHLRRSARLYRSRRDATITAIRRLLPATVTWRKPAGGIFLWLELPAGVRASSLLPRAIEHGVEFAPGTRFFADPRSGERFLRLNFAVCTQEEIEIGIERLAAALDISNQ
jgi:GntR family transcriptional regulator/MocR family aminotransferase